MLGIDFPKHLALSGNLFRKRVFIAEVTAYIYIYIYIYMVHAQNEILYVPFNPHTVIWKYNVSNKVFHN